LSDRFRGGVTKQVLCPGVPGRDDALERLADDGVIGRRDDRRQQLFLG
jgi:hypothetical protein